MVKGYYNIVLKGYEDCGLDTSVLNQALVDSAQRMAVHLEQEQRCGMHFFSENVYVNNVLMTF